MKNLKLIHKVFIGLVSGIIIGALLYPMKENPFVSKYIIGFLFEFLGQGFLRLVKMAIDGAHKYGKWCGCCGEMASDSLVVPVLVGLGLDEFSISADSILNVRKTIKDLARNEMEELANEALKQDTEAQVRELVEHRLGLGQYHLHN